MCFTESEFSDMIEKAQKAHLSAGGFIHRAVKGLEVKEAPSADVPILIREIRRVGYNIEQILKIANIKGMLDVPQLRKVMEDNRAVEKLIVDSYTTRTD